MKSKTPRTSKSSRPKVIRPGKPAKAPKFNTKALPRSDLNSSEISDLGEALSVGHQPSETLSPRDESLFRAFQSNLLSLISHEMRTPLSAILNALSLLEEASRSADHAVGGLSSDELIRMARQNSQRLQSTLAMLLDLAALESGTFHARLREVDLERLVMGRVEAHESLLKDRSIKLKNTFEKTHPLLGDPQKLSRAIDLCLQLVIPRAATGSVFQVRISSSVVEFEFQLTSGVGELWESSWSQALVGFQGGVASPASAFGGGAFKGVMQSEQGFLTRMEEGLGSELILIHEILRMHQGKLTQAKKGDLVTLRMELPEVSSAEGIKFVLSSRAFDVSNELTSVALVLVQIPKNMKLDDFCEQLKETLFRSTDAVYPLPPSHQAVMVLDDLQPKGIPPLLARLKTAIKSSYQIGVALCPTDTRDPAELLEIARGRLAQP